MKKEFPLILLRNQLNMDSERIPRSLRRGLASELQRIIDYLAWKIPCLLVRELQFGA